MLGVGFRVWAVGSKLSFSDGIGEMLGECRTVSASASLSETVQRLPSVCVCVCVPIGSEVVPFWDCLFGF